MYIEFSYHLYFSYLRTKFNAECLNVLFHTRNSEECGFLLHLIYMHRRTPGHFFSSDHLTFRIDLLTPPHSLLEIAATAISKHLPKEALIDSLNIPNNLRPLIRGCFQWHHSPVLP